MEIRMVVDDQNARYEDGRNVEISKKLNSSRILFSLTLSFPLEIVQNYRNFCPIVMICESLTIFKNTFQHLLRTNGNMIIDI